MLKTVDPKNSIYCSASRGPYFGWSGCLGASESPFNGARNCKSYVDSNSFGNTKDNQGNSIFTGKKEYFTAVEFEVFKV